EVSCQLDEARRLLLTRQARLPRADITWMCSCAALVAIAIFLARPVVEMAVNDEWAYVTMAGRVAATGSLPYDGWTRPMVGPLAYWTAAWIKLFGFSFAVARASVFPFLPGTAVLIFAICRRLRITAATSAFCALLGALSPLLLPVGTVYMTDLPALFFFLLTLWFALKAV